jgi:hypothetical protein
MGPARIVTGGRVLRGDDRARGARGDSPARPPGRRRTRNRRRHARIVDRRQRLVLVGERAHHRPPVRVPADAKSAARAPTLTTSPKSASSRSITDPKWQPMRTASGERRAGARVLVRRPQLHAACGGERRPGGHEHAHQLVADALDDAPAGGADAARSRSRHASRVAAAAWSPSRSYTSVLPQRSANRTARSRSAAGSDEPGGFSEGLDTSRLSSGRAILHRGTVAA